MKTDKALWVVNLWFFTILASPLPAQSFEISSIQRLTNQETALGITAPVGRAYRLESAEVLPQWAGLVTFATNNSATLQHTDSATRYLASRYYRVAQLSGTNVVPGDHLSTTNGDVIFYPRNHATFVMQWDGKMIYTDPVSAASYTGLPKADLILITHTHGDHFSTSTIDSVRKPNTAIIGPQAVYNGLTAAQKALAVVLGYGASTNLLGLSVEAVYASNSNHGPAGTGNGYVVTVNGKRIYISGDTGDSPQLQALSNIAVAFVGMNRPYTLTVMEATNLVRAMRPAVVYPYHYRDSTGAMTNAATFKDWLGTDLGIEVRLRKWY